MLLFMSNFWGAHHFGCWRTPIGIWRRVWRVLVRQFGGRANRVVPPTFGADPKIYGDGDRLELEGYVNLGADLSQTPIVFQRVNR